MWLRTSARLSWMLNLIEESLLSILQFLMVLIMGIFAFADAFRAIERVLVLEGHLEAHKSTAETGFFEAYLSVPVKQWQKTFLVSIGEFPGELENYSEFDWIIFFTASMFNLIIMLNLLISIISETYANISSIRLQTGYKELAMIVHQRYGSALKRFTVKPFEPNNALYIAHELSITSDASYDETNEIIDEIQSVNDKVDNMEHSINGHVKDGLMKLAILLIDKL